MFHNFSVMYEILSESCLKAFTTTLAAYTVALPIHEYWAMLGRFLLVSAIVRGAACTSNDILDRDVDAGVGMHNSTIFHCFVC